MLDTLPKDDIILYNNNERKRKEFLENPYTIDRLRRRLGVEKNVDTFEELLEELEMEDSLNELEVTKIHTPEHILTNEDLTQHVDTLWDIFISLVESDKIYSIKKYLQTYKLVDIINAELNSSLHSTNVFAVRPSRKELETYDYETAREKKTHMKRMYLYTLLLDAIIESKDEISLGLLLNSGDKNSYYVIIQKDDGKFDSMSPMAYIGIRSGNPGYVKIALENSKTTNYSDFRPASELILNSLSNDEYTAAMLEILMVDGKLTYQTKDDVNKVMKHLEITHRELTKYIYTSNMNKLTHRMR